MVVSSLPLLDWARRLRAIAQTGLTFTDNAFDRQRYEQVRQVAAEMAAHPGDAGPIDRVFAGYQGYATPLLICRAAVFNEEEQILMVREVADDNWTLPGGWIDVGESPREAAEREVWEETGYRVKVEKLAAVYDKLRHEHPPAPHHAYLLFFLCELMGGEASPSIETSEVAWFGRNELPMLSVGRATAAQIDRMFVHRAQADLPTDLD